MNLTYLMMPFLSGLAAFTLAVFHNISGVNIEAISVPGSVTGKTGFTQEVVIRRLADRMLEIEHDAQSRADAKPVMTQDRGGAAAILGDFFNLKPLLRVVQTSFGLIPYRFSGEIVVHGPEMEMVLRGRDAAAGRDTLIRQTGPADDVPGLVDKTAYEAVRMIDPSLLAAYQFRIDYLTRNFTPTEDVIRRALAESDERPRKWLLNLWGIVLYQEADRTGAVEKFRQALEIDPRFASPLFNWGVTLARQGNHREAIEKYMQVVEGWRSGDPADMLAAAYTEWGFSLALLGETEDAIAKFRRATEIDPGFSDAYTEWAEVLSILGRSDEGQAMTLRALRLARLEKVSTDNLVGRLQNLPAVAAGN